MLLKCKPVLLAFPPPPYMEVTEAGSSHDRQLKSTHVAIQAVDQLPASAQPWVLHYALHCNPEQPDEAAEALVERWYNDRELRPPPVNHVADCRQDADGGESSTACIITHHSSPASGSRKHDVSETDQAKTTGDDQTMVYDRTI